MFPKVLGTALFFALAATAGASRFQVIYERPIAEFARVVADAAGAAYFFDRNGDVVRVSPSAKPGGHWTAESLYTFSNGVPSGAGTLLLGNDGALYGPTEFGGAAGCGDVFGLAPPQGGSGPWTYSEIYASPCIGGNHGLDSGIVRDAAGDIFGSGGYFSGGDREFFYELTPPAKAGGSWTPATLFDGVGEILSGVAIDARGNLYIVDLSSTTGPTQISKLSPPASGHGPWTKTVIYSSSTYYPASNLSVGSDGSVYGATRTRACGAVFALVPQANGSYAYRTAHAFSCSGPGGAKPDAVIAAADGTLYGTASGGGHRNGGVVFTLKHARDGSWVEMPIHEFGRGPFGTYPTGVTFGPSGSLYGQTLFGGAHPPIGGTVFRLDP